MSQNKVFELESNEKLKSILSDEKEYTFLLGAGISMNPPSNLPSARQIVKDLISLFAPSQEINKILEIEGLRYEMVVEGIEEYIDSNLNFLDYFELAKQPNLIHFLIAHAIVNGQYAITTNFDFFIEYALNQIVLDQKSILPIITKQEFMEYSDPFKLNRLKKHAVYKIHGSKKNIITNEDTKSSLITTISALGKDRAEGQTFAIETYKKPAVNNLIRGRTLIVMGYSGSDDFDITPTLREFPELKRIIWINHIPNVSNASKISNTSNTSKTTIYRVVPIQEINQDTTNDLKNISNSDKLLISLASDQKTEVLKIDGDTVEIIKELLWNNILPQIPIPQITLDDNNLVGFSEWIKEKYNNVDEVARYKLAWRTYYDVGKYDDAIRVANFGLDLAQKNGNKHDENTFLNDLGLCYDKTSNWDKAIEVYKKAFAIAEELKDIKKMFAPLNNLGLIYHNIGKYDDALEIYNDSLKIVRQIGYEDSEGSILNNCARIYSNRGDYEDAIEFFQQSIKIAEKIGNLSQKAIRLNNLGFAYKSMKEDDKALEKYNEALKIGQLLNDSMKVSFFLNNIGSIYLGKGKYDDALKYFEESYQFALKTGDLSSQARALSNKASIFKEQGKYEDALNIYQHALEISKKLNDLMGQSVRLLNIGDTYFRQKKYDAAIPYLRESIETYRKLGMMNSIEDILIELSIIFKEKNDTDNMAKIYDELVEFYNKKNDLKSMKSYMFKAGINHHKSGRYEEALSRFKICLHLDEEKQDLESMAVDSENIASSLLKLNRFDESISFFKKAAKLYYDLAYGNDAQYCVKKIIDILNNQKRKAETIEYHKQLIDIEKKRKKYIDEFNAISDLAFTYFDLGKLEESLPLFEEALKILEEHSQGSSENAKILRENIIFVKKKLNK